MKTARGWVGAVPKGCQICEKPLMARFYDARLPSGSWAILGPCCFEKYRCSLGTGRGQEFRNTDGVWLKVAG